MAAQVHQRTASSEAAAVVTAFDALAAADQSWAAARIAERLGAGDLAVLARRRRHDELARRRDDGEFALRSLEAEAECTTKNHAKEIRTRLRRYSPARANPLRYDPSCPIPLSERIARAAMDHANAVFAAGGSTDFERRQADLRRLRSIHNGDR